MIYKWAKGYNDGPTEVLKVEDGKVTADQDEMHNALIRAWADIFSKYVDFEIPRVEDFMEDFGDFVVKGPE
eukprot:1663368-Alexandrium_andersonii.AAC.1